jgi:hypothetical protein
MSGDPDFNLGDEMFNTMDALMPFVELATGFRNNLISQGWTPEQAQESADIVLKTTLYAALNSVKNGTVPSDES